MKKLIFGIFILILSLGISQGSQAIELSYLSGGVGALAWVLTDFPVNNPPEFDITQNNYSATSAKAYVSSPPVSLPDIPFSFSASAYGEGSISTNSGGSSIHLGGWVNNPFPGQYSKIPGIPNWVNATSQLYTCDSNGHAGPNGFIYFQVTAPPGDTNNVGQINYNFLADGYSYWPVGSTWSSLIVTINGVSVITTSANPDEPGSVNPPNFSGNGFFDVAVGDIIGVNYWFNVFFQPELNGMFYGGGYIGGDFYLNLSPVPASIPVPGAVWLFGSGLLGLVGWRKFRKS